MSDDIQAANQFFQGAHHFYMKDVQLTEITTTINVQLAPPGTTLPPLPPLKHSSNFFTGRDGYLKRLKDHFMSDAEGQRKSFLLYGLGGIGKTQITLRFIEQSHDFFSDIFWLDASSEATLGLGLMQITQANHAPKEATQSPGSALNWIAQRSKWLMVYDSADGHYSVVEKLLPPGNGGNILITSRNAGLKRLTLDAENILDMADEEAILLLLKSAMLDGRHERTKNMAKKVVSQLGGVPLALDQAGAYIQSCGCSIDDYLELYTQHQHELMSGEDFKGASDYGTSTYGTWDISMKQIEGKAASEKGNEGKAAQNAIRLLRIFAFLHHEKIPTELFKNAAENYIKGNVGKEPKPPLHLLDYQTLFLREDGGWERLQFLGGIQILLSYSLIKSLGHLYSMHMLVNAWSRNYIPKEEIIDHYLRARALLCCSIVPDPFIDNYRFCKVVAPHLKAILFHASELWEKEKYYDSEYDRFVHVFDHVGNWDETEKILNAAVSYRKTKFGLDHSVTLSTQYMLASVYENQGRWDEAEKLGLVVTNARKAKLGTNHVLTLNAMHNLAITYWNQGRWKEAETLQIEVINARKSMLGPDHPDTLKTVTSLAVTYQGQGRWNESENLHVEVLNTLRRTIGADHPFTLKVMHNLATLYWHQGKWSDAEKLQIDLMHAREEKLGSDHPETLDTMNNLASTYWNQGRWAEAEKLNVEVMQGRKNKLGTDHPDTLLTMQSLATIYMSEGKQNEAENLLVHVVNVSKAKLGADHPDTLAAMHNLASAYQNQGKLEDAESLGVHVMNGRKEKLGSDHPDTLSSMHNVTTTYQYQARWDEAEKLGADVIHASKAKLGANHPFTLTAMASMGVTYTNQGKLEEALAFLSHTVSTMQQVMGSENPMVQTVLSFTERLDTGIKAAQQVQDHNQQVQQMISEPSNQAEESEVPKQQEISQQMEPVVQASDSKKQGDIRTQQKPGFMKGFKGMWKKMKH